ncbi:MAG TPA: SRPBCC family protein [Chitinophagaceae bacterium]|nr:SRPBCC family protein [Chitinophagaceae bacterium]
MRLQSKILVEQNIEQVTKFLYEPSSLAKWDRSVSEMIPVSSSGQPVGSTFDTIAPSGMKMNYEVIEFDSERSVKIKLNNSKMFKTAIWHFQFDPIDKRTEITCNVFIRVRFLYIFLYPVLYFSKSALLRDLTFLKTALNENCKTVNS